MSAIRTLHIPTPSVGRIVHYGVDDGTGSIVMRAAIIVYVFGPNKVGMVNLSVFQDGPMPPHWATSVPYGFGHNQWHYPAHVVESVEVMVL